MARKPGFWCNVGIIALAHVVVFIALVRWSGASNKPERKEIVWLDVGAGGDVAPSVASNAAASLATPDEPLEDDSTEEDLAMPAGQSDLQLPTPTPTTATTTRTPRPKPSVTPKSDGAPKPSPKKTKSPVPKTTPKATPKPKAKKATPTPFREERKEGSEKSETPPIAAALDPSADHAGNSHAAAAGSGGQDSPAASASEANSYRKMLHDRFHSAWEQPTSVLAAGAKISALVKIRVEKDGRISDFTIVRASGNVVVDESVAEVAKRVTQVDPLPKTIASGREHFDVNVNFEVNPE